MDGCTGSLRLASGVALGSAGNYIAVVPGKGSFVIDPDTHRFLTDVHAGKNPSLDNRQETVASIARLRRVGILDGGPDALQEVSDGDTYTGAFTDLLARRESKTLGKVISWVGVMLSSVMHPIVVVAGTFALLVQFVYWIAAAPVDVIADVWLNAPLQLFAVLFLAQSVRLLLHESGHYAVARRAGREPEVGVGMYFTGPVIFVDLTPLDVTDRKTRLTADMAGLAMDGFFVTLFTASYLATQVPLLAAVSVTLASVAMASMYPTVKSDGYWAMRDLLNGRAVSYTWASPLKLLSSCRRTDPAGRFARYLVLTYAVSTIWTLCVAPRWVTGVITSVQESGWQSLLLPAAISLVFLLIAVVAAEKTRRVTGRR